MIDRALEAAAGSPADNPAAEVTDVVTAVLGAQLQLQQSAARRTLFGPKALATSLRRVAAQPSTQAVARQGCAELVEVGGFTSASVVEVHPGHYSVIAHTPERDLPEHLAAGIPRRPDGVETTCMETTLTVNATAATATAEFSELLGSTAYSLAPVVHAGRTVGLVHAAGGIGLYGDAMALSYAREVGRARMAAQHSIVARQTEAILEATRKLIDADLHLTGVDEATITRAEDTGQQSRVALTPREQEIMHLIAAGATNNEIAERLFISLETVKSHVKKILRKTGSVNRSEAIVRYLESN